MRPGVRGARVQRGAGGPPPQGTGEQHGDGEASSRVPTGVPRWEEAAWLAAGQGIWQPLGEPGESGGRRAGLGRARRGCAGALGTLTGGSAVPGPKPTPWRGSWWCHPWMEGLVGGVLSRSGLGTVVAPELACLWARWGRCVDIICLGVRVGAPAWAAPHGAERRRAGSLCPRRRGRDSGTAGHGAGQGAQSPASRGAGRGVRDVCAPRPPPPAPLPLRAGAGGEAEAEAGGGRMEGGALQ